MLSVFEALSGDFIKFYVLVLPTPTGVDFADVDASTTNEGGVTTSAFTAALSLFLN
jgi:hypothetical protein